MEISKLKSPSRRRIWPGKKIRPSSSKKGLSWIKDEVVMLRKSLAKAKSEAATLKGSFARAESEATTSLTNAKGEATRLKLALQGEGGRGQAERVTY